MRQKIVLFGDSIIRYNHNKLLIDWSQNLKVMVNENFPNKYKFITKTIVGLNSTQAVRVFNQLTNKIQIKNAILIVQLGINDSWHFKSLYGKPNVSFQKCKMNFLKIINKAKKSMTNEIFLVSYHKLLNNRLEINNKTINENLGPYLKLIKKICYKEKIKFIDVSINTKNIKSKKMCRPLPDGIHLSQYGAQVYSKLIFKTIQKYL